MSKEDQLRRWLAAQPRRQDLCYAPIPGETPAERQARLFKGVLYELSMLIGEFGYEAVYFGVGCEAFPETVDPGWQDGQY